jgi:enoyl-CoA hydratase/carnithine racemase
MVLNAQITLSKSARKSVFLYSFSTLENIVSTRKQARKIVLRDSGDAKARIILEKNCITLSLNRIDGKILLVELNRPEFRNAINFRMMEELYALWTSLHTATDVACVILTGQGKAFCAGADLKERNGMTVEVWREQHAILENAMAAMINCPIPILAAVNGAAFGGGLEIVLGSDFAYASTEATFAMPETRIGIMPGAMGTQNLPRACGNRRAKEICFTGRRFSAMEALEWGIVNRICSPEALIAEILQVAQAIERNAPLAIRQVKKAMNVAEELGLIAGYRVELEAYNNLLMTKDREEGVRAFNEKRAPHFRGS